MVQEPNKRETASADLIQDFRRLGFTEYEAKIYMQLLTESPATAYEIAKATGVPRPNTYNALESLAKRGAVQPISENPVRYVAAPPDRHLKNLGRQTMAVCDNLAKELARLKAPEDDPYVWNVQGELAIYRKISSLISESRSTICIKAADEVLRVYSEALREAAERGVEILIVLFGTDPDEFRFNDRCQVYLHEANGMRMGTADNLFTLTIDHREAVTATTDRMTAFHTRNYSVVQMADSLIRHDYYMAEIHLRFGSQIEEVFGPHLKQLRLRRFTKEQAQSFRERTGLD
ncbi:TrmB family transcriptional regulator [Arvimicrobium flavum]|uniref:TrmB family transcriptional regulator n=1 Tax=Arvimicrobium flavum TaxID=3393320 RepID=UPI00237AE96F|nr:TrmB family transcriptional regulator [Mesorhizobium shangrilense]